MRPERARATRRRVVTALGTTLGALGLGASAGWAQESDESGGADATQNATADGPAEAPADVESEYAEIYRETIDGVVLVTVPGAGEASQGGLGSGFVYDDEHLVTNAHVAGDATEVEVQFRDEQWRTASVAGSDVHSDLAVLRIDDLPDAAATLSLADADPVIGQEVLALGNPLGFDASISQGIVSGVDRSLPSPSGFAIPAAVQTDAPVAPGNSGGPLVGLDGEILGVVFAGAGTNVAFAISAGLARRVVPALIEDGSYEHSYVGVGVSPVGPLVAEVNDLDEPRGVTITEVTPDSPADGVLQPATELRSVDGQRVPVGGDVVVAIDGTEIATQERLSSYLALETSPGETIAIDVVRDGAGQTVELTLEARPPVEAP